MRLHAAVIVLLAGALVLAGCFEKQRLTGKWQTDDAALAVEFLKNGDVLWTQPLGTITGTWEVVENERVKVSFTGIAGLMGPQYCGYAFEEKALVLSGDCILAEHYNRAKS